MPRAFALICRRTMLSGSPALLKQIIKPFGLALVDAAAADHVSKSLCSRSSSSMTRSLLSPRPALRVGAPTLYCLLPVRIKRLLPFVLLTLSMLRLSSGILSWSFMTASQTSSALSSDKDVPNRLSIPSTFKKNDASTSDNTVLPFWRLTRMRMVLNLNFHSFFKLPSISRTRFKHHSCHG